LLTVAISHPIGPPQPERIRPDLPLRVCDVAAARHTRFVDDVAPKTEWVVDLPAALPAKLRFASLADLPHEHEGFTEYEAAADPDHVREETAQRQFRGQYLRRLRRLRERKQHCN
jgi:hypothetical protein